jgi:magnesium transporter
MQREASLARESMTLPTQPPSPMGYPDIDSDDDDVNEVEMVLEAYFMQVDNTYNKLQTLCEYIDDTEVRG